MPSRSARFSFNPPLGSFHRMNQPIYGGDHLFPHGRGEERRPEENRRIDRPIKQGIKDQCDEGGHREGLAEQHGRDKNERGQEERSGEFSPWEKFPPGNRHQCSRFPEHQHFPDIDNEDRRKDRPGQAGEVDQRKDEEKGQNNFDDRRKKNKGNAGVTSEHPVGEKNRRKNAQRGDLKKRNALLIRFGKKEADHIRSDEAEEKPERKEKERELRGDIVPEREPVLNRPLLQKRSHPNH